MVPHTHLLEKSVKTLTNTILKATHSEVQQLPIILEYKFT